MNKVVGVTNKNIIETEELELSDQVRPGELALSGRYTLKISLEATYSSRTHFVREAELDFEIRE